MTPTFGQRLATAMDSHGPLCLGIDPHPQLLTDWGLDDTPAGLERFCLTVLDAAARVEKSVAALKPQVALFERFGSAGFQVLEKVLQQAADARLITIADAKRGDIGSTMAGYAEAWLADGAALAADALTVNPYLGYESLRPAIDLALDNNRGLFVLGLTSNPEGASVQHVGGVDGSVAGNIISAIGAENQDAAGHLGSVGIVVGATVAGKAEELGIKLDETKAPLLAPGYGSQGATAEDLRQGFAAAWPQVLVNSSRAILRQGPTEDGLVEAIEASHEELVTLNG